MPENAQVQAEPEKRHIIWSNVHLDYERDWKADLEEQYPDLSDDERIQIMYESNREYLDDARMNLNINLNTCILVIADLGLWNGRHQGYKEIESGKIKDCLNDESDMCEWYVDSKGDFRCNAYHHDGTNHYLYRAVKDSITEYQYKSLLCDIYMGKDCTAEIAWYTERIGDEIGKVYGWDFGKEAAVEPPPDLETEEQEL